MPRYIHVLLVPLWVLTAPVPLEVANPIFEEEDKARAQVEQEERAGHASVVDTSRRTMPAIVADFAAADSAASVAAALQQLLTIITILQMEIQQLKSCHRPHSVSVGTDPAPPCPFKARSPPPSPAAIHTPPPAHPLLPPLRPPVPSVTTIDHSSALAHTTTTTTSQYNELYALDAADIKAVEELEVLWGCMHPKRYVAQIPALGAHEAARRWSEDWVRRFNGNVLCGYTLERLGDLRMALSRWLHTVPSFASPTNLPPDFIASGAKITEEMACIWMRANHGERARVSLKTSLSEAWACGTICQGYTGIINGVIERSQLSKNGMWGGVTRRGTRGGLSRRRHHLFPHH